MKTLYLALLNQILITRRIFYLRKLNKGLIKSLIGTQGKMLRQNLTPIIQEVIEKVNVSLKRGKKGKQIIQNFLFACAITQMQLNRFDD